VRSHAEKTHAFTKHLADVSKLHSQKWTQRGRSTSPTSRVPIPTQTANETLQIAEVQEFISNQNPKKLSGYDLITGKILKELLIIGIKYLTLLFSAVLFKGYFPVQWKVSQVILILKAGKPPNELTSYQPISLPPNASKRCEELLLQRLLKMV
jgi:hypothetical protein